MKRNTIFIVMILALLIVGGYVATKSQWFISYQYSNLMKNWPNPAHTEGKSNNNVGVKKYNARKKQEKIVHQNYLKNRKKKIKNTIQFKNVYMSWKKDAGASEAPEKGAGAWYGTGLTHDGKPTHFIGHNPGAFHEVTKLKKGDKITVIDSKGKKRTYKVNRVADVYDNGKNVQTHEKEMYNIFIAPGERITLQTCLTSTKNRLIFAK
ncbi:sortase [Periweissella cryptocerci]|nr:sortase [Periweissella cryptocerci]